LRRHDVLKCLIHIQQAPVETLQAATGLVI
jgi:hypothetical protein